MSFITVDFTDYIDSTVEAEYRRDFPLVQFFQEKAPGTVLTTIVGPIEQVVGFLAKHYYNGDDSGLIWLITQIQLEDESMNEHNAAASAVGL